MAGVITSDADLGSTLKLVKFDDVNMLLVHLFQSNGVFYFKKVSKVAYIKWKINFFMCKCF